MVSRNTNLVKISGILGIQKNWNVLKVLPFMASIYTIDNKLARELHECYRSLGDSA